MATKGATSRKIYIPVTVLDKAWGGGRLKALPPTRRTTWSTDSRKPRRILIDNIKRQLDTVILLARALVERNNFAIFPRGQAGTYSPGDTSHSQFLAIESGFGGFLPDEPCRHAAKDENVTVGPFFRARCGKEDFAIFH